MKVANRTPKRKLIRLFAVLSMLVAGVIVAPFLATATGASQRLSRSKPYQIYLSNNYVGNGWRVQMEKEATAAAKLKPFKGNVKLTIVNAGSTIPDQIASIEAITARKPAAILIDAASPTALDPAIAKACSKGIVVVNFDSPAKAPCSFKIFSNFRRGEVLSAEWLASVLKGKGHVFEDTGLAGNAISATILRAWKSVLSRYPGIKVVGTYQSSFAIGPEESGVASLLAAHPTVSAILTQGYCTGAIKALQAAGHALVPMLCQAYNQSFLALARDKGASGFIMENPAYLSVLAMKTAMTVLEGKHVKKLDELTPPCFYKGGSSPKGAKCAPIKVGVNAFPRLSPTLTTPSSPRFVKIPAKTVNP